MHSEFYFRRTSAGRWNRVRQHAPNHQKNIVLCLHLTPFACKIYSSLPLHFILICPHHSWISTMACFVCCTVKSADMTLSSKFPMNESKMEWKFMWRERNIIRRYVHILHIRIYQWFMIGKSNWIFDNGLSDSASTRKEEKPIKRKMEEREQKKCRYLKASWPTLLKQFPVVVLAGMPV